MHSIAHYVLYINPLTRKASFEEDRARIWAALWEHTQARIYDLIAMMVFS